MLVLVDGVTYDVRSTETGLEVWRERDEVNVGSFTIGEDWAITIQGWFAWEVSAQTLTRIAEAFRAREQARMGGGRSGRQRRPRGDR